MSMQERRLAYHNIHHWLRYNFGSAKFCELCKKTEGKFEYALKKGKVHAKDFKSYLQLCKNCHMKYDSKRGSTEVDMTSRLPSTRGRKKMFPKTITLRVSEKHGVMVRKLATNAKKGDGEIIREAIEEKFKKEA